MRKVNIVLYMPALHQGFIKLLTYNGRKVSTIFLISEKFVQRVDPELASLFEKHLNAIPADQMQKALSALQLSTEVKILDEHNLQGIKEVIIPEDDVVERVLAMFYPAVKTKKETRFLRWGKKTVLSQRAVIADATVSVDKIDKKIMVKAFKLAEKSSDWWRQVGAIIFPVKGEPISAFNTHLPHEQAPDIQGDPRSEFKPGENIDLSTAIHAESAVITYAARKGIALEGASIYVTTLPCPPCAWQIRSSGIKKVYYCEGYSILKSVEIFRAAGIQLIFVDVPQ